MVQTIFRKWQARQAVLRIASPYLMLPSRIRRERTLVSTEVQVGPATSRRTRG